MISISALSAFSATRIVETLCSDPLTRDPICWLDNGVAVRLSTLETVAQLMKEGIPAREAKETALSLLKHQPASLEVRLARRAN